MGGTYTHRTVRFQTSEAEYFGPGGWTPLRAKSAVTFYPPVSWPLRRESVDRLSRKALSISYAVGSAGRSSPELCDRCADDLRNEDQAYRNRLVGASISLRASIRSSLSLLADCVLRGGALVRSFSSLARGISPLARSFVAKAWRNRCSHLERALRDCRAGGRDEASFRSDFKV